MTFKLSVIFLSVLAFSAAGLAQQNCEVVEAQQANIVDGDVLGQGTSVQSDTRVSVGPEGVLSLMCGSQIVEIGPNTEGPINEVSEFHDLDVEIERNVSIDESLKKTEQIEENLDQVNQAIDETLPGPLKSLIMGDKVNFEVDNTTIGIKSNNSGITGVEEGGVEDPTLEISMEEETVEKVLESDNTTEEFREAYEGDGIEVEAHSWKNKIVFGAIELANKAYGIIAG